LNIGDLWERLPVAINEGSTVLPKLFAAGSRSHQSKTVFFVLTCQSVVIGVAATLIRLGGTPENPSSDNLLQGTLG
jgi:hypothetical protein